ncbi:MAG TPA: 1-deoxy-D-xylulose-5-phosphate synthase [Acidimicrobiales bacterium]
MTTAHPRTDSDLRNDPWVEDDPVALGAEGTRRLVEELDALDADRLRRLSRRELDDLAGRIRAFLVHSVSVTGGHLGPNLGVVELTLALHRTYDCPTDQLVWDTGHQAYVHKLLTGRAAAFDGLRQAGGLSGYPNRAESEHDIVENSHASTGLSYAYGLSRAHRLTGLRRRVVAVVGDGALTGGLAYEALNNIGATGTPVVIVLNDNGRSYSPTVSPLNSAADRGRLPSAERGRTRAFFEALGIAYEGPFDGHDVEGLEWALREANRHTGPVVVHVHTVKGRGYGPAEADEDKRLHDVAPFDPRTGVARAPAGPTTTFTQAFASALVREGAARRDVVAITAAMAGPTGLRPFADRFPDRFLDVGIAEQHAVTAAAGMAMAGLRPVVAIYSTFLNRAWDQVYYDVGLHRLPVVFCVDRAGVTGDDGPSHHGLLDLALLTKVPGMTVLMPSNGDELAAMLHHALEITSGPVAIRWPKTPASPGPVGHGLAARRVHAGRDVCLLGAGKLLGACQDAAELLADYGVDATVWDIRAAVPLDPAMIDDAGTHQLVVVAEDGVVEGGVGASVAAAVGRLQGSRRTSAVIPCGVPVDYLAHGSAGRILAELGLDGPGLCRTVLRALGATVPAAPAAPAAR